MIPGVNFQPGTPGYGEQGPSRPQSGSNQGVQEAIKVLSLRLPKVVGARSVAPAPLLTSQGSGGSPHVDSIVESVLARVFPGRTSPTPTAPMFPTHMGDGGTGTSGQSAGNQERSQLGSWYDSPSPRFGGAGQLGQFGQQRPTPPPLPDVTPWPEPPRIIVEAPTNRDFSMGMSGQQTGALTQGAPDLRSHFDWLPSPSQDVPLF